MSRKGIPRDKNLDCPNVVAYKDVVHLSLNYLQRQYVVDNVSCCERGQRLWRATLTEIMLHGNNPRNIPYFVKLWSNQFYGVESARFEAFTPNGNGDNGNG